MATGTNEGKQLLKKNFDQLMTISNTLTAFFSQTKNRLFSPESCIKRKTQLIKEYSYLKNYYCIDAHEKTLLALAIKVIDFYSEDIELRRSPEYNPQDPVLKEYKEKSDALLNEIATSINRAFLESRIYFNIQTFDIWSPQEIDSNITVKERNFLVLKKSILETKKYCKVDTNTPCIDEPMDMLFHPLKNILSKWNDKLRSEIPDEKLEELHTPIEMLFDKCKKTYDEELYILNKPLEMRFDKCKKELNEDIAGERADTSPFNLSSGAQKLIAEHLFTLEAVTDRAKT